MKFCMKYTFSTLTRFKLVYVNVVQTIFSLAKTFVFCSTVPFLEWTILSVCHLSFFNLCHIQYALFIAFCTIDYLA